MPGGCGERSRCVRGIHRCRANGGDLGQEIATDLEGDLAAGGDRREQITGFLQVELERLLAVLPMAVLTDLSLCGGEREIAAALQGQLFPGGQGAALERGVAAACQRQIAFGGEDAAGRGQTRLIAALRRLLLLDARSIRAFGTQTADVQMVAGDHVGLSAAPDLTGEQGEVVAGGQQEIAAALQMGFMQGFFIQGALRLTALAMTATGLPFDHFTPGGDRQVAAGEQGKIVAGFDAAADGAQVATGEQGEILAGGQIPVTIAQRMILIGVVAGYS